MELTLEVLVDLAGPLEDGSRASQKLREKLEENADLPDVESLLDEALDGTDSYHNRALQDIMNNLGQRLGFDVELDPEAVHNVWRLVDYLIKSAMEIPLREDPVVTAKTIARALGDYLPAIS